MDDQLFIRGWRTCSGPGAELRLRFQMRRSRIIQRLTVSRISMRLQGDGANDRFARVFPPLFLMAVSHSFAGNAFSLTIIYTATIERQQELVCSS
jgi:hypothetical protein